jgi:hypothetical protein
MSEKPLADLFLEYHEAVSEFLKFDELNLKDSQMNIASVRHYWVGRLMFHKQQIQKLTRYKQIVGKKIRQKIEEESPVGLTAKTIAEAVGSHDTMQKIEIEIADHELLVEYLTKVEMNFRDAQYGLNNLTKIITLETT